MFDPNSRHLNNLLKARAEWLGRQQGTRRPKGAKRHGVWRPTGNEAHPCCVKFNTRLDLYEHCLSLEHVARMYGVKVEELTHTLNLLERES